MTGEELKERRSALQASQGDVAYHSGISRPNVAAMELGTRVIGAKSQKKLETALSKIEGENDAIVEWFEKNEGWMDSPALVEVRRSAGFAG